MYKNTIALAKSLGKPIVAFDLEHTGGAGEGRAITEFGAMRITPEGELTSYASLVKPPLGAQFNPYVCRMTGIHPETVEDAPSWEQVLLEFVMPNKESLWVGFNSRTCDTPLLRKESGRCGHELGALAQLDLLRVGPIKGGLSSQVLQLVPDFDTSGAHRGLKDALMTLVLLEAKLPLLTEADVRSQCESHLASAKKSPRSRIKASAIRHRALDVRQFLVAPGVSRKGQQWTEDEAIWVCKQFKQGKKTIPELALLNGRSPFGVACALHKEGLIDKDFRDQFNQL